MTTKPTPNPTPFYGHARCSECGMGEKQGHVATCSKIQAGPEALRAEVLSIIEYCEAGDDTGDHRFTPDAEHILLVIEEHEANQRIYTVPPTLADVVAVLVGVNRG